MLLFDNKNNLIYHCGGGLYLKIKEKAYFVACSFSEKLEIDSITEWLSDNFDLADIVYIKHGRWFIWGFDKIEDAMAFKLRWL